MKNCLGYQVEKYQPVHNRIKSANLDELDYSSDNDSKSIIDFDDEYSEVSNLYSQKNQKVIQEQDEEQINEEDEQNNYYEYSDTNIKNVNTLERKMIDQNVKQLMEIDTNDKQGIINILMQDNLIQKKPINSDEVIKEKNKNKYYYVQSKSKREFNNNKKNTYGRNGYMIEAQEGDPEFIKDINVAGHLLKEQIQEKNEDIAKLLFDEFTPNPSTKKILTRREIGEKIKKTLEKKRKNLEKIEAEMYEEQKENETFAPMTNTRRNDDYRRNFGLFLRDQSDFQKKVELKKQNMLIKSESEKKMMYIGHPNINKNSEEIAKKLNSEENVYIRLYNRKSKGKDKDKNKSNEKIIVEEYDLKKKRKKLKRDPYSHIKSKINIFYKSPSQLSNDKSKSNISETRDSNRKALKRRTKSAALMKLKRRSFSINDLTTNKMLYNKFIKNFEEALKGLNMNIDNNNEEELELDESQYHQLLYNLGMVSYKLDNKENNIRNTGNNNKSNSNISNNNGESFIDNSLKLEENRIVSNSFNLLKLDKNNDDDKIKVKNIKNFLIFVLNLQNYHLYYQFKLNHTQEDIRTIFPANKFKKEDIPNLMVKMQSNAILSEIDHSKSENLKYCNISKDNKIIFTLDKAPAIVKDFVMFSLNYRNKKPKSKKEEKIIRYIKKNYPFKPKINENSEKIYQKNRDKVYLATNDTCTTNSQYKKNNMDYIDRILLLDKKRIAENQKIKEELEKKKIKECTFKPKINTTYPFMKKQRKNSGDENNDDNNNNKTGINRIEELYEKGKQLLQSRRDRTREEIDIEEQGDECTFQPDIYSLPQEKIPDTNFTNDIYNEKEYKYQYERLKHGRLERMVKDSNNDRFGLNNELKQFVKDNKEYNYLENQAYFDPEDPYYYNVGENQYVEENNYENNDIDNVESDNMNINQNDNINGDVNNDQVNNGNDNQNALQKEDDPERKDDIPLLIIDVNIRQGIKKKIYVYEGDTPEALAEKFAKEHNLPDETKNKLQNLIHSHMVKLLTRIDEENQSVSEKSQIINKQN